jgi:hydrogenase expression/formation protein HypD
MTEASRRPAEAVSHLAAALAAAVGERRLTFMEVCGTHTMAIARYGLRQLLPASVRLVSGPGCPVCVTAMPDLDRVIAMARLPEVTLCTFGDLVRVPASHSTLAAERAAGADVRVVYSALDAVDIAVREPQRQVVFAGIGFETTAPTVAAALITARQRGVPNFSVLSMHKTMPAALRALLDAGERRIDGFILPGHVSVITGSDLFGFLADEYGVGGVVAGFEPDDVMRALLSLAGQQRPQVTIEYTRAVQPQGNRVAQQVIEQVFAPCDADWRGLGVISGSGLRLANEYASFAAESRFTVEPGEPREPAGCRCGDVLRGLVDPPDCALFGRRCTPEDPIGACMVSSEGSCAAYYRYRGLES